MRSEVPELAQARVIELRELYTASGSGVDALAALNAALARHAKPGDATALVLGHNPGWEEAVALLTCAEEAEAVAAAVATPAEAAAAETCAAAELRTAQGALLRSEHRSWGDALGAAWTPRGDVAPPQRKDGGPPDLNALAAEEERPLSCGEQLPCVLPLEADSLGLRRLGHAQDMLRRSDVGAAASDLAAAKHPTQLSDAELTVAMARAERALPPLPREVWRALALAPEEKHLDAIAPAKGRDGKARASSGDKDDDEAALLVFAAGGDGLGGSPAKRKGSKGAANKAASMKAAAGAAGAPAGVSFAHFYAQPHAFTDTELAAARAAVDAYLALRPEMLRRLVDKHGGGPALQEFLQWGWVAEALTDSDRFCCMEQQHAGDGRKERELRWTGYAVDGAAVRAARAARQGAVSTPLEPASGGAAVAATAAARAVSPAQPAAGVRRGFAAMAAVRSPSFADVDRWWAELSLVKRSKLRARLEAQRRAAADPRAVALAVAQVWKAQALAQAAAAQAAARPEAAPEREGSRDAAADADVEPQQAAPGDIAATAAASTLEQAYELASPEQQPEAQESSPVLPHLQPPVTLPRYSYTYVQPKSVARPGESVAARARREAAEAAAAATWALECVRAAWQIQY